MLPEAIRGLKKHYHTVSHKNLCIQLHPELSPSSRDNGAKLQEWVQPIEAKLHHEVEEQSLRGFQLPRFLRSR